MKLAIFAKEGISIDILQEASPDKVTLSLKPVYEEDMDNRTAQSEGDRRIGNQQLKNAWLNKCQKIEAAGILCGDRPWKLCDTTAVSLTYLSLGTEGRRICGSQELTTQIDPISTKDLWESLDNVFTKQRKITFDRYTFLKQKLLKGEPVEKLYLCLRELSLKCDLSSHEESVILDVFVANIQDGEIQRELLKETRSAKKALEVPPNNEMGIQNQLQVAGTAVHTILKQAANTSVNSIQNPSNRPRSSSNPFVKPTICPNCGYGWSASHRRICPARGKNCKNCGVVNHFAKVCRKRNA